MYHPAAPRCDLSPSDLPLSRGGGMQDPRVAGEPSWYDSTDVVSLERMQARSDPVRIFHRLAGRHVLPTHAPTMPPLRAARRSRPRLHGKRVAATTMAVD